MSITRGKGILKQETRHEVTSSSKQCQFEIWEYFIVSKARATSVADRIRFLKFSWKAGIGLWNRRDITGPISDDIQISIKRAR